MEKSKDSFLSIKTSPPQDGADALNNYEAHCPEWVLMDVEMERMDGFTATREIMKLHPEAKILILTKYETERMREEAKRAGAYEYILKENLLKIREILQ